ncbi:MAG: hypothetical protein PHW63_09405 [Alphaproteobacteria bacterium]|nr:hypothetical protein [Alphaproteobacteria bacterium]
MAFFGKNKEQTTSTERFCVLACLFVFCVSAIVAIGFVPMNMDEAGIFHSLACLDHPFAKYNLFRETCYVKNDLTLAGGFTLFRPQFYTGLFHSVLYAPFFKLFHAQAGQYLFGLVFLVAFASLMARQTKQPRLAFALTLAFFPFTFQFIHDTGPVKFVMLLFPLAALMLRRLLDQTHPARWAYALLLPVALFLATEEKAFFLYLLPSLFFFALTIASEGKTLKELVNQIKASRWLIGAAGLLFAMLAGWLLLATNSGGVPYIIWLTKLVGQPQPLSETFINHLIYLFWWPAYAHNYFEQDAATLAALLQGYATLGLMIALGVWGYQNKARVDLSRLQVSLLALSLCSTALVFFLFGNAWAGHHFITLWAPLFFIALRVVTNMPLRLQMAVTLVFLMLNLASILTLSQQKFLLKVDPEKEAILAYLDDTRRAEKSIYNFTTWGAYYIQALYGPKNQMAVYTEPYEPHPSAALYPEAASQILRLAAATNRKIYTICSGKELCSQQAIEQAFGGKLAFKETLTGLEHWHLFEADPIDSATAAP